MKNGTRLHDLADGLRRAGVDEDTIGHLVADVGDLLSALDDIERALEEVIAGHNVGLAIEAIESEARDHMPNHVRSLQRAPARLRRALDVFVD
ncbi:MAG: hypothetical protein M3406_14795 [Chloroflexota bacterium]|nr:hypothetical protein [Chloroflexota bacterium]